MGIIFDVLPFQSFDNLRELCIESSDQTSFLLQRIAASIVGFERLHIAIKSGLNGRNEQSKVHQNGLQSLFKAIFSEFNFNALQLLSFDILFDFDAIDLQSASYNSVDLKLNKLQKLYELLNQCLLSQQKYVDNNNEIALKLRINLKYNIENENNVITMSKRQKLINVIAKKSNYFPMLFYELNKHLLKMRKNVMLLFKSSFSDKSLY